MLARRLLPVALLGAVALCCASCSSCGKQPAPERATTVRFNKVPLDVQLPPGWAQSQNTAEWLVYRPAEGGALAAMSGERSCPLVEKRLYSALIELGLDQVVWKNAPTQTTVNGLRAIVAEGTALEAQNPSKLRYSIVQSEGNMGCLVTLVSTWQSKGPDAETMSDRIIRSVKARE